jgi:tRNA threonylcarbamoyl adenosine modification protein (Sua5/YciO/YrdC/YwlC family)
MAQFIEIHPDNPQPRLLAQVAACLNNDGLIAYPTDSCYALGCLTHSKIAVERIIRLRRLNPKHNLTLICRDLADIGLYAKVDNKAYRFIKGLIPGPYAFLLKASRDVPRRLQHPQTKTIGLRIPDNPITQSLLEQLDEPMLTSSLILPENDLPETEPEIIFEKLQKHVDIVIDGGAGGYEPTTVLDLTGNNPEIVRQGKGEISHLMD